MHTLASLRCRWQQFIDSNATPGNIAAAFALGTLISVLPTPGLNIALASGLTMLFKSLNRVGLFAAIGVWNAIVVAPLYALSYRVGDWLFADSVWSLPLTMPAWMGTAVSFAQNFLIGNLLVAITITLASYAAVYKLAAWQQNKKGQPVAAPLQSELTGSLTLARRAR